LQRLLLLAALVLLPGYSYSDSIAPYYGQTGNAAANGLNWSMGNVLPTPPGLDINAVIYNYTIRKQTEDSVTVHVQNENANGTGYIFRETDEWRPGSLDGTQINKVVGVGTVHRDLWGDGSIVTEGNGSVEDPTVVYTYRVDPCYDPQFDPNCPGYKVPVPPAPPQIDYEIYDATQDMNDSNAVCVEGDTSNQCLANREADEEGETDEEKAEREEEEEKDSKERLEKALAAADNSAMFAQALAQSRVLDQMNLTTNMNTYYAATIDGGTYAESVTLVDKQLPDNKQGLRNNRAQQLLHQQMVDEQYK
jgi:hypothetical protein